MGKPRGNAENIESIITRTVRETIEAYRAQDGMYFPDLRPIPVWLFYSLRKMCSTKSRKI